MDTKNCSLCNNEIPEASFQNGDAFETHGEYWHSDYYVEYFEEE